MHSYVQLSQLLPLQAANLVIALTAASRQHPAVAAVVGPSWYVETQVNYSTIHKRPDSKVFDHKMYTLLINGLISQSTNSIICHTDHHERLLLELHLVFYICHGHQS